MRGNMMLIKPLKRNELISKIQSDSEFCFDREKGWVWLQKICFWILRKLDLYAIREKFESEYYEFNTDNFFNNFMELKWELLNVDVMPKLLIIGRDEWLKFQKHKFLLDVPVFFEAKYEVHKFNEKTGKSEFFLEGIKVEIVPWMSGWCLI